MKNETLIHIDLFSGIGGFALATERVFGDVEHTFVEWDPFCQEVLKKHWPEAEIHGDIDKFIADSKIAYARRELPTVSNKNVKDERSEEQGENSSRQLGGSNKSPIFLLTGGFPCQPFSQAGRRQGTADDRYKWPSMLNAITLFRPEWIIAENVAGLASWNDGLVLETVCSDLETQGYEVQPFVIPAVAVGAPHRRDRIWIVAHRADNRSRGGNSKKRRVEERKLVPTKQEWDEAWNQGKGRSRWQANWLEVATRLCRVDDGIPRRMDRNPRLKALGNAIVPQVAEEIMRAMV